MIWTCLQCFPTLSFCVINVSDGDGGRRSILDFLSGAVAAIVGAVGAWAASLFAAAGFAIGYEAVPDGPAPPAAPVTSRVYLDVAMKKKDIPLGRIVIGLYGSTTPRTAHNFEALCRGAAGPDGKTLG